MKKVFCFTFNWLGWKKTGDMVLGISSKNKSSCFIELSFSFSLDNN